MHLKKLEIQGFKSFPEYTLIEFDEGMTAIVGPNGSGKSNVTDAVRWVLGEQSVRTLRGGKMEDVIFNGTQSRRAMNYAEVTMTIDNSDGQLEIDYAELQITRRLYRSGESEYQINHVSCRLKDIVQLFMDTGLGKDGYSIVGQGRIDDILSSRSEDRRKVLEEASGIVKYKARKDEAERKLLSTEQNLIRITDILEELSEQIEPLGEQAEKAKLYHRAYDEWKQLDVALTLHNIDSSNAFLSTSDAQLSGLNAEIKVQEDRVLSLRENNRALSEQSSHIEEQLEKLREDKQNILDQVHKIQSDIAVVCDRREQLRARLSVGEDEDVSTKAEIERLDLEINRQNDKVKVLEKQLEKYKEQLKRKTDELQTLSSSLSTSEKEHADLRARLEELESDLFDQREHAQSLSSDYMLLDAKTKTLEVDRMALISEKDAIRATLDDLDMQFNAYVKSCKEAAQAVSELQERISEQKDLSEKTNRVLEQKNREMDNVVFRTRTLEELEKNKEGYQEPVRRLLDCVSKDSALESCVIGVLGDLIRVPREYETAIEIALGAALHNIVTQNDTDASTLISCLKNKKLGRVTFLPIQNVSARPMEDRHLKALNGVKGFIGIGSDVVEHDSSLNDIISRLLGRIALFKTIDDALVAAKRSSFAFKCVSLDGDVINPGGSMTGGSLRRHGPGVLGRARELEDLNKRFVELEKEIAELESDKIEAEHRLLSVAREQAASDDRLRDETMKRVKVESEISQKKAELLKLTSRLEHVETDLTQISKDRLNAEQDKEDISETIREIEKESSIIKETILRAETDRKEVQLQLDELRSIHGDLKVSVESVEISLTGAREMIDMIRREKTGRTDLLDKMIQEREQASSDIISLQQQEEQLKVSRQTWVEQEGEIGDKIKVLLLEKDEVEHRLSGFIDQISSASETLSSLQNEKTRIEAKRDGLMSGIDELKNRLWEDHELTYDNAQEFALEIDQPNKIQKRISELKAEIKAMGSINMNAVDEYNRVNDRFTFMTDQKEDIVKAKVNLEKVIEELTDEMRRQFMTHFQQINENFKTVFSDLFNGGTAEILLRDEEDILTSNIDIKAQPPGKRLQNLSLLSGGERCLTAIALLFAILQLKPSPFCVLDEVEAALDDVNVTRFTDFVRRYTEKSQFILVTHRKGTMEACDRMYGVTMQERGISKILSMRLGDQ